MTTYFPFTPSAAQAFNFQPTLDGQEYNVTVVWSLFGQRYYVTCTTLTGALIFHVPLIGSSVGNNIQAASWDASSNTATITTVLPHGFKVGRIINLTIVDMHPDTYNGAQICCAINRTQLTFPITSDPGTVSTLGSIQYNINLAAGYFASTLVYRTTNDTFEVSP
jgi:hypothetical protein